MHKPLPLTSNYMKLDEDLNASIEPLLFHGTTHAAHHAHLRFRSGLLHAHAAAHLHGALLHHHAALTGVIWIFQSATAHMLDGVLSNLG